MATNSDLDISKSIFCKEIVHSIQEYTNYQYSCINGFLRTGQIKDGCNETLMKHHIKNIDTAFRLTTPLEYPLVVYRGVRKREYITTKSYMSTSIEETTAITFARDNCCMLVITIPAGSKVLNLTELSVFTGEQEILLPRNSELYIVSENYNQTYEMNYIHLTYIPKESKKVAHQTTARGAIKEIKKSSVTKKVNKITKDKLLQLFDKDEVDLYGVDEGEEWFNSVIQYNNIDSRNIDLSVKNSIVEILNNYINLNLIV